MRPSIIRHPDLYLWNVALEAARARDYQFSIRCEEYFRAQVKSGLEVSKVGMYEFAERVPEARANVEKLVAEMISEEAASDPNSRLLHDSAMFNALYHRKLCPGLWPLC